MRLRQWTAPGIAALMLLAACDRGAAPAGTDAPAPGSPGVVAPAPWNDNERTWAGLLPCSDCQGVDTRLVLRARDGKRSYLLSETYLGSAGKNSFSRAGSWIETTGADQEGQATVVYVLDPDQAGQRYAVQPDGALELLDGNGQPQPEAVAYRLQRL